MDHKIGCPACNTAITVNQLFWTATLLRFKCPHCATRLQPKDKTFAMGWLAIAGIVGILAGVAAVVIFRLAPDGMPRILAYGGLVVLAAGATALIKWRASLAMIKKTELKIVP